MTTTRTANPSLSGAAERYNASLILDDNLAAGRGDKVAIRTPAGEEISYAELAEQRPNVPADGDGGDIEPVGDFTRRETSPKQVEHL